MLVQVWLRMSELLNNQVDTQNENKNSGGSRKPLLEVAMKINYVEEE